MRPPPPLKPPELLVRPDPEDKFDVDGREEKELPDEERFEALLRLFVDAEGVDPERLNPGLVVGRCDAEAPPPGRFDVPPAGRVDAEGPRPEAPFPRL